MKKFCIISIIALNSICGAFSQSTTRTTDSLRTLLKSTKNDTHRIILLNTLSAYLIIADSYDSALIIANEALLLSEKLGYQAGIASSFRKQGVARIQTGEYARALENLLQSLRINETLNNREEIFKLQNNIGNLYYSQGNFESALSWFMKAYAQKKNDAFTNSNIGITYLAKEDYKLSLVFLEKALKFYSQNDDDNGVSNMIAYIGTVYEQEGSYGQALEYYSQALKIKEEIGDLQGQSDALGSIGDILFKQKKYIEAIAYQNKSIEISRTNTCLSSVQESEGKLFEIFEALGDTIQAHNHYKKYISIRDSLYNEKELEKTVRSQMNFDFDKQQAIERAVHEGEIRRQQILRNSFIAGFALVLVFSIFIFRGYKKTRKQKSIIEEQKRLVDHKNQEITDSINYAQRIQRAILPSDEYLNKLFPNHFVCYKPKDIVSGDFYWSFTDGISKYLATADCTGHSVPGAMMSMIGASLLNEIVIERKITSPDQILNTLREEIIKAINHEGADEERKDGMDISFIKITDRKLECASANNSIFISRRVPKDALTVPSLIEIKADHFPVGKYITNTPFKLETIQLYEGDIIYTMTDGYCDQFGGDKGKKLMIKRLKDWIIELDSLEMSQIKMELECRFNNWKKSEDQVDDVTIVALKV